MFVFDISARAPETQSRRKKADLADIKPEKSVKARIRGEKMSNIRMNKIRNFVLASAIVGSAIVPTRTFAALSRHDKDRLEAKPVAAVVAAPIKINATVQIISSDTIQITLSSGERYTTKSGKKEFFDALPKLGLDKGPTTAVEVVNSNYPNKLLLLLPHGMMTVDIGSAKIEYYGVTKNPINLNAPQIDSNGVFAMLNDGYDIIVYDRVLNRASIYDLTKDKDNLEKLSRIPVEQIKLSIDVDVKTDRMLYGYIDPDPKKPNPVCEVSLDRHEARLLLATVH